MALNVYRGGGGGRGGRGYSPAYSSALTFVDNRVMGMPPRTSTISRDPISNNYKLHIKNIPKAMNKITLTNVFLNVGQPLNVYVNNSPGRLNWGFVEFEHFQEAAAAIKHVNSSVFLEGIEVSFAKEKMINPDFDNSEMDYSVLDEIMIANPAAGSPVNLERVVKNDQCLSYNQESENDKYIIEGVGPEMLACVEEALYRKLLKYHKENPTVGKCSLCGKESTLACSPCGTYYCSELCRNHDWPTHYKNCNTSSQNINDKSKEPNLRQKQISENDSKFVPNENENKSIGSHSKQRYGDREGNVSKTRKSYPPENNVTSKYGCRNKDDKPRGYQYTNESPRNMFLERKSRFDAEKQNQGHGRTDNRSGPHGFSNNNDATYRGPNFQVPQKKMSTGHEFISKEEEFRNEIERRGNMSSGTGKGDGKQESAPTFDVKSAAEQDCQVTKVSHPSTHQTAREALPLDRLESGRIEKVTYAFKSEDIFYIQIDRDVKEFHSMSLALNHQDAQRKTYSPVQNGLCMASFEDSWCRCEIINLNPLEVHYVDYGNTEHVTPQQLYTVPREYTTKLPFAIKVKLAEGSPEDVSGMSVKPIRKFEDYWLVEVEGVDYTKTNKSSALASPPLELSHDPATKEKVPEISGTDIKADSETSPKVELKIGVQDHVTIFSVVSEGEFFVVQDCNKVLVSKLMEVLTKSHSSFTAYTPVLGGVCVVCYEGIWYRCKVINLNPIEIHYIDFGYTETVTPDRLFTLPPEHVSLPPQALKIKLVDGTPDVYLKKQEDENLNIIPVYKKDTFWEVQIVGVEYPKLSTDTSTQNSISPSTDVQTSITSTQDGKTSVNIITTKTFDRLAKPIPLSSGDSVDLCKVIDACTLLVTPADNMEVEQLIQIECSKSEEKFTSPPSVGDYVAYFAECSKIYARSRIDYVDISNNKYDLYNIDLGNKDSTQLEHLHPLPAALCMIPPQVTEIKLKGLEKVDQTEEFQMFFRKISDDETILNIEFEPESNLATLTVQGSNESINEKLKYLLEPRIPCNESGKYTLRSLPYKKVPTNEIRTFLVTQTEPLYVQLYEEIDAAHKLSSIIAEYVETEKSLYNPSVDELCVAVHPEYGDWYRCVCMKEAIGGISSLMLIDYGDMFTADPTNIRKIPQEMLTLPSFGIACKIKGLPEEKSPELLEELKSILPAFQLHKDAVIEDVKDGMYYLMNTPSVISKLKDKKLI